MKQNIAEWIGFTNCKNTQEILLVAECVQDAVVYLNRVKADYDGLIDNEMDVLRNDLEVIYLLVMNCYDSLSNSYRLLEKQIPTIPTLDEYYQEAGLVTSIR